MDTFRIIRHCPERSRFMSNPHNMMTYVTEKTMTPHAIVKLEAQLHYVGENLVKKYILITLVLLLSISVVQAQDTNQEYFVQYGAFGPGNIAVYAFAPTDLQVHRGDTVTWILDAETNVHFEEAPLPVFIPTEVNGQQMPIYNPGIAFATIESGAVYSGGDVNSGALGIVSQDLALETFSLVIDLEPGVYTYFSDLHPRSGTITVVPDDQDIPSPIEVTELATLQLETAIDAGVLALEEMPLTNEGDDSNRILVGKRVGDGTTYLRQFFPPILYIQAGETVTWEVPAENRDGHTITWPSFELGQLLQEIEGTAETVYGFGPILKSITFDGDVISANQPFNALVPGGNSLTVTFEEPGIYPYVDNLHVRGMQGMIVVLEAEQ